MITAPYNFVPLNKKVFYPSWANNISHDIPFSDGESGIIDIEITAKSPIFIRDGKEDDKFCNHNGDFYIPSSSIKGMVRNVLEIMSFSKMDRNSFDDDTYSVRDLSDSNNFYMKEMKKDTFCGWLKKTEDGYIIEDCGKAGRIKHEEIDKIFNINFASKFKKGQFGNKAADKTALKKYEMIKNSNFTYPFVHTTTSTVGDKRYSYDKTSSKIGTIVFTGQPSGRDETRKIPSGKVYEFIFFDKLKDIAVDKKTMENFLFAYFDKRETEPKESPDWKFWKEKLYKGEKIPVFFQKNGGKIAHFGLSYLYKLPYKNSVINGIPDIHFNNEDLDMAQTIFGYINKDANSALKGRLQFSHFKAISNITQLQPRTEILGTPRASYYPIYVKQKNGQLFTTFMDSEFELAGRKRYPIHKGNQTTETEDTGNDNVGTTFTPLKEGVVLKGKLRYHNLKKAELGAILSTLTFHNSQNKYHNIGMAKSLGYGKIDIKLDGIDNINLYLKEFELIMSEQILNWADSIQLKELLTMATEQNNIGNSKLAYMKLEEFAENKKRDNQSYLKYYSELKNIDETTVVSLISQDDLEELEKINIQKQREKEEKENAEKEAKREAILKQEKEKEEEIKKQKAEKAQGLALLNNCKNFKDGMKIINDSLGKKAKPTQEQLNIIRNFYKKSKDKKTKQIEKFFKKF
jgi:CRISPR-associated protein (TIGR03986 family)